MTAVSVEPVVVGAVVIVAGVMLLLSAVFCHCQRLICQEEHGNQTNRFPVYFLGKAICLTTM